jgi:hypothetical protein
MITKLARHDLEHVEQLVATLDDRACAATVVPVAADECVRTLDDAPTEGARGRRRIVLAAAAGGVRAAPDVADAGVPAVGSR